MFTDDLMTSCFVSNLTRLESSLMKFKKAKYRLLALGRNSCQESALMGWNV